MCIICSYVHKSVYFDCGSDNLISGGALRVAQAYKIVVVFFYTRFIRKYTYVGGSPSSKPIGCVQRPTAFTEYWLMK